MVVHSLEEAIEARGYHNFNPAQVQELRRKITDFFHDKTIFIIGSEEQKAKEFLEGLLEDFGIRGKYAERTVPLSEKHYLLVMSSSENHKRGVYTSLKHKFKERVIHPEANDYFAIAQALSLYIDQHKTPHGTRFYSEKT